MHYGFSVRFLSALLAEELITLFFAYNITHCALAGNEAYLHTFIEWYSHLIT